MIENKYRVWDKEEKRFWYFTLQEILERQMSYRGSWDEKILRGEKTQYIGLKDKNNIEIYAGDIVLTQEYTDKPYSTKAKSKRHIGVVEYQIGAGNGFYDTETKQWNKRKEYSAKWIVNIQDKGKFTCSSWGAFFDCEIIGNIFENPELITTK